MKLKRTGLRQAGEIITLIGAIIETIGHVLLVFGTFFMWLIPAAIIIPLLWVSRTQGVKGSKGWNIYGIVQGVLFGWISLVGHILLLVDHSQQTKDVSEYIDTEKKEIA